MTAQEFYKENKGKYFMYRECRVRVVGVDIDDDNSLPIMIAYKDGYWSFPYSIYKDVGYVVDESLINDGDMGEWVSIESLIPIEEELNLCELLKGCEGIELWSDIFGKCKLLNTKGDCSYKIEVQVIDKDKDEDGIERFTQDGKFYIGYPNAKCMLWTSESNRDWSTFVNPNKIKEGTPVMRSTGDGRFLREYACGKEVALDEGKLVGATVTVKYIVPATDFDFTDFESNKSKSII